MKKLLTLLLVFGFVFSVSAVTAVQSKTPDKLKIEKTIFKANSALFVSLQCEQLKEFTDVSGLKEFPSELGKYSNFKEITPEEIAAEISRKSIRISPIITS